MAWVNWNLVCTSKSRGDLGIKNLEAFKIALLSKWRWRLLQGEDNSLRRKLLVERYSNPGPWFEEDANMREIKDYSIWWRDLQLLGKWLKGKWEEEIRQSFGQIYGSVESLSTHCSHLLFTVCMNKEVSVAGMGRWQNQVWSWIGIASRI